MKTPAEELASTFWASAFGKKLLADEQKKRQEEASKIEAELLVKEADLEGVLAKINSDIEVATRALSEAQRRFLAAQATLGALVRKRMQTAFAADAERAELTARLKLLRNGKVREVNERKASP